MRMRRDDIDVMPLGAQGFDERTAHGSDSGRFWIVVVTPELNPQAREHGQHRVIFGSAMIQASARGDSTAGPYRRRMVRSLRDASFGAEVTDAYTRAGALQEWAPKVE